MNNNSRPDEGSQRDLALELAEEFDVWFRNLGSQGIIPRAFTGVTSDGRQFVVVLSGLSLNHSQRRNFLIWLCRHEQFVAYAYGTLVGIAQKSSDTLAEGLDIYSSSSACDVSISLSVHRLKDATVEYTETFKKVVRERLGNLLFFQLQHSAEEISSDAEKTFRRAWCDLKPKAMFRQRW